MTLASNNASLTVPASATVLAGAATATFSATASTSIAINQTATVTATLGSSSQTVTISLLAPVLVSGVVRCPTALGQSAVSSCTVTLTQTAPMGGSNVTLASNNASLTVPASVTVAAGATRATFSATAVGSIASDQSATLTASLGSNSQTASITLLASASVLVSAVGCSPISLGQGAVSTCTVTLTQIAPTGGSSVTLASNNASLTVPASGYGSARRHNSDVQRDGSAASTASQSKRDRNRDPRKQFPDRYHHSVSVGVGSRFGCGLQSHQSRAKRCQHLHGDADPDRSGGWIESDSGQQQYFAYRAGIGHDSGGSRHGYLQRHCIGFDRQQSNRNGNGNPRKQFANGNDQSAGAGSGFEPGLRSHRTQSERRQHLHGDADPDRSRWRIDRDGDEQQRFAHRTTLGYRGGWGYDSDIQGDCVGQHRQQSERDRHRHPRQQFPNRHDQSAGTGTGAGLGPGL